jgi:hypothetical protein
MRADTRAEMSVVLEDLQRIFGDRLEALVAYGLDHRPVPSLAIVDRLTPDDLAGCAARVRSWQAAGAATPLLLSRHDFIRSADVFPIEYAEMHDTALVLHGANPFALIGGINAGDVRRACEAHVRSHLLHLREDYLECGGSPAEVGAIVRESVPAFAVILRRLARLFGETATTSAELTAFAADRLGADARVIGDVLALGDPHQAGTVDAFRTFPAYVDALERLSRLVDEWPR